MCSYKNLLAVTNRHLVKDEEDYIPQIEKIMRAKPKALILREKDMEENTYERLAKEVIKLGMKHGVVVYLHSFTEVAENLGITRIHMSLTDFKKNCSRDFFSAVGVSVHSVLEAIEAEKLGASYITAGHIFDTECKLNVPSRGLEFLKEVVENVNIPVYAIGGITPENLPEVIECGAAGGCMMSYFMKM